LRCESEQSLTSGTKFKTVSIPELNNLRAIY